MDIVSQAVRSRMMSGIQGKNSRPELIVRSIAHALGLRFRLHDRRLPGTPDLVLRKHRTVIFVHGCFWHRHGCALTAMPKTRTSFWMTKFAANQRRDSRTRTELVSLGWRVLELWECETRRSEIVNARLVEFFGLASNRDRRPAAVVSPRAAGERSAQQQPHRHRSRRL